MMSACSARHSADCWGSRRRSSPRRSGRGRRSSSPPPCARPARSAASAPALRTRARAAGPVAPAARADRAAVRDQPHDAAVRRGGVRGDARGAAARDLVPHDRAGGPDRARPRRRHPLDPAGRSTAERPRRRWPRGADVIIAQGGEAGGHGGEVGTMVLVPQVVDVAGDDPGRRRRRHRRRPRPGGRARARRPGRQHGHAVPGRGRAGDRRRTGSSASSRPTRSTPSRSSTTNGHLPPFSRPGARVHAARAVDAARRAAAPITRTGSIPARSGRALRESLLAGRGDEYLPFAGQSVGLIDEVLPAAEIVRRVVAEAEVGAGARSLKVLAIDGGGIRGLIPARVLAEIERRTRPRRWRRAVRPRRRAPRPARSSPAADRPDPTAAEEIAADLRRRRAADLRPLAAQADHVGRRLPRRALRLRRAGDLAAPPPRHRAAGRREPARSC